MKLFLLLIVLLVTPQMSFAVSGEDGSEDINWGEISNCISGCVQCLEYRTSECCVRCGDGTGGGGGHGYACTSYSQCPDISDRTRYQDTGSAATVSNIGIANSTNVCFDINGVQYYIESATSCRTNYSRVKFVIHGCSDIAYYQCVYNYTAPNEDDECDESTCIPDAWSWVTSGNNAVQRRTNRGCGATGKCTTVIPDQVRCPTGYYGTPNINFQNNITAYCTPCPSDPSGAQTTAGPGDVADSGISIGGGTTGRVSVTECYVPAGVGGNDETGTWVYDRNCHYSQQATQL